MNLLTALFVGLITLAAFYLLMRFFPTEPQHSKSFVLPSNRGGAIRYHLLFPAIILSILPSLLWTKWLSPWYWALVVVVYLILTLSLPWLKGHFRTIAFLLSGIEGFLFFLAVVVHFLHSPQAGLYVLMMLYLLLPVTALSIFLALFAHQLIPVPPGMDASAQAEFNRKADALFAAAFSGYPKPILAVRHGTLIQRSPGNPFLGEGPGLLMTDPEYAVLIRDGARVRRVVGPGVIFTGGGDVADYVFDLRRQQRGTRVRARTREGIELEVPLSSVFHLQRGDGEREPQLDQPWPYRPSAAIKLYFSRAVDPEGKTPLDAHKPQPWQDLPLEEGIPVLKQVISLYTLDEIYGSPPKEAQAPVTGGSLRLQIGAEVREQVKALMQEKGIQVIGGGVGGTIKPVDESIFKQRVKAWQAQWAQKILRRDAAESAEQLRNFYLSRYHVLNELLAGLKRYLDYHRQRQPRLGVSDNAILSLRLLETFEDLARRSKAQDFLPDSFLKTLDELHQRLLADDATPAADKEG